MKQALASLGAATAILFLGCTGESASGGPSTRDIVHDEFPEAQNAVREAIHGLNDIIARGDWDGLRKAHLESPKFSDVGGSMHRSDFEEMIEAEVTALEALNRPQVEWRELKIDVFGDVTVSTVFPRFTGTDETGKPVILEFVVTFVHVKTLDGWKIAHEHVSEIEG